MFVRKHSSYVVSLLGCVLAFTGAVTAQSPNYSDNTVFVPSELWCDGPHEAITKFQLRFRYSPLNAERAPVHSYEICLPIPTRNSESGIQTIAARGIVTSRPPLEAAVATDAATPNVHLMERPTGALVSAVTTVAAGVQAPEATLVELMKARTPEARTEPARTVLTPENNAVDLQHVQQPGPPAQPERPLQPGDRVLITYIRSGQSIVPLYLVQPGDTLTIGVEGVPELDVENSRVLPDGSVFVPQIGSVKMAGASVEDIVSFLEEEYKKLRIRQPKVKLTVNSINDRAAEFLDGLSAGGNTSGPTFTVTIPRGQNVSIPFVGEFDPTAPLPVWRNTVRSAIQREFGGTLDVILNVERATFDKVFVIGEVARPSDIDLAVADNAFSAIAAAGGFLKTAARERLLIVRTTDSGSREIIPLNLKKLILGREEQPALNLLPNDILVVPPTRIAQSNTAVEKYVRNLLPFDLNVGFGVDFNND